MKERYFLARDRSDIWGNIGRLGLYVGVPPTKNEYEGYWERLACQTDKIELDRNSYPEIKWSDVDPTEVELLIKIK